MIRAGLALGLFVGGFALAVIGYKDAGAWLMLGAASAAVAATFDYKDL